MSKNKRRSPSPLPEACVFCGKDIDDEFLLGKFFHAEGISVHQNCMFFSSGLGQGGDSNCDGILGFLLPDIKEEVLRGKRLRCYYCKSMGATIGCCEIKCRKTFHFECGVKNHSLHQYYKKFESYCKAHKPKQDRIEIIKEEFFCRICFLPLLENEPDTYLHSPCCRQNWFHRTCLQEYALNAGRYFFKCPLCNNSTEFIEEMLFHGICIPEQDASWELEENAYQDLLQRPECGAIKCDCKNGKNYSGKREWALLPCLICGSKARHKFCEKLEIGVKSWKCNECATVENKITERKYPEVTSKEVQDVPKICHPVSISPSKSILCPESSTSSLKSITNTLGRTVKCPVVFDPTPSEILEKSQATSEFNVKRKRDPKDQPMESKAFLELKTNVTSFESINSRKCPKNVKQSVIKLESSETFVPYIVKYSPAKTSKVSQNHSKKLKKNKSTTCCSSDNRNHCIKKMFGQDCHNYRV